MHGLVCKGYSHIFPCSCIGLFTHPGCTFPLVVLQLTDEKYPETPLDPQFTLVLTQVETVLEAFQKIKCSEAISRQCSDCSDLSLPNKKLKPLTENEVKNLKDCIFMMSYHVWNKLMLSRKLLILQIIFPWKSLLSEIFPLAPKAGSSMFLSYTAMFPFCIHSHLCLTACV